MKKPSRGFDSNRTEDATFIVLLLILVIPALYVMWDIWMRGVSLQNP